MKKREIKIFAFLQLIFIGSLILGCSGSNDQLKKDLDPEINFSALSDLSDSTTQFSQVILRIELLNTSADILKYGLHRPEEHQQRLSYYLFGFKNDVSLISRGDTIPCYDLLFERTYMDLPYMNFILTFNHDVKAGDEVMIHDTEYTKQNIFVTVESNLNSK